MEYEKPNIFIVYLDVADVVCASSLGKEDSGDDSNPWEKDDWI